MATRAIRLVEGGLEDHGQPVALGHARDRESAVDGGLLGLDHVESGDQDEARAVPHANVADAHGPLPRPARLG